MTDDKGYRVPVKSERRICLIVVDLQNCFFDEDRPRTPEDDAAIGVVAKTVKAFNENSRDIFVVKHIGSHKEGPSDDRLVEEIRNLVPREFTGKFHMGAFQDTCLADLIKSKGYDSAIICGAYTEYCVMASYWSALEHDIAPFLLAGGTVPYRQEMRAHSEAICYTFTYEDAVENLTNPDVQIRVPSLAERMRRKYWYVN